MNRLSRPGSGFHALARSLLNIGVDPRRLIALRHLPKFISQYINFKRRGGVITHSFAVLSDYEDDAGVSDGHYFHQDLLVAKFVHDRNPARHVDIGSRIDGFVAHVASYREIEVMDIRALASLGHDHIKFLRADLMNGRDTPTAIADSISCLHSIEHFGLGRYGDSIEPMGHHLGYANIVRMLKAEGTLYISFPIGQTNEVHFNAHRVFHPRDILTWPTGDAVMHLERFDFVDDSGRLHQEVDLKGCCPSVFYGCGIYTFRKLA